MDHISTKKDKDLSEKLISEGFSSEEIQNVFAGLKNIEEGKIYTAEEVYTYLLEKETVYV